MSISREALGDEQRLLGSENPSDPALVNLEQEAATNAIERAIENMSRRLIRALTFRRRDSQQPVTDRSTYGGSTGSFGRNLARAFRSRGQNNG